MNQRKIHRTLGLLMMLPMLAWAVTGLIFLVKPGYEQAYEQLVIKTYDIESPLIIVPQPAWEEIKLIRSVLGLHLLVRVDGSFRNIDPVTFLPTRPPSEEEVRKLINDAISVNADRYGVLESVDGSHVYTSTGVEIVLNWNELKLGQQGKDSRLIDTLYEIHYLQWTKWEGINRLLGLLGIFCLTTLTIIGFYLFMKKKSDDA